MQERFKAGDLFIGQRSYQFVAFLPLRGPNDERMGSRFPDMMQVYDRSINQKGLAFAQTNGIKSARRGLCSDTRSNLETKAEHFFQRIGGDAVGMSTVPEVIIVQTYVLTG